MGTSSRPIIVVDGDGVTLNYNLAFGIRWRAHFGLADLPVREPRAYHAHHYWGITPPAKGHPFWDEFDRESWHTIPGMPRAQVACHRLHDAGYDLVCVTSIPAHREAARLQNFRSLDFPIERVIATGSSALPGTLNPKKAVIDTLSASWVVDDELRKLIDLNGPSLVLVDPGHPDSPNGPEWSRDHLTMEVGSLDEFAERLLGPYGDVRLA
jgi:hypothetical protein